MTKSSADYDDALTANDHPATTDNKLLQHRQVAVTINSKLLQPPATS